MPGLRPQGAEGDVDPMRQTTVDMLARALAMPGTRRRAITAAGALFIGVKPVAARKRRDGDERKSTRGTAFSRKCKRFVISAGPNRNDRFQHTDDDVLIE